MSLRHLTIIFLSFCLVSLLTVSAHAREVVLVDTGVSSDASGYTISLTIEPGMNYLTFARVSPTVDRVEIRDAYTGNDLYYGTPSVGTGMYLPAGRYLITGWCDYCSVDTTAVTLALAPDEDTPIVLNIRPFHERRHGFREFKPSYQTPLGTRHY